MTNEEMQKAMEFIVEMQKRNAITLDRFSKKVNAVPVARDRSEKRWKRTEERLRALLAHAKKTERRILLHGANRGPCARLRQIGG